MIRQPLVVVMGNVDSGKCVHPSSLICLSNGEVLKIEDLWNNKLEKDTYLEEDSKGFYFKPNLNLYNIDINKKKYEKREIFRICKLKSPKELVYFKNNFGQEIQVTKEHPFFILNGSNIKSKKAIDVKEGDFVLCPKIIKKDSLDFNDCRDYILNLLLKEDIFLFKLSNKKNLEVERVLRKNKLFSKLQNKINNNRYRNNDLLFLQKYLSIKNKEIISIKFSTKKQRASHRSNWINIPKTQKGLKELFYLVGLIFGDGTSQGTSITNIDEEIHKNAINIFRSYLGVNAKIYKPKEKAENIVNNGGKTLKLFLEIVFSFPKFKKSNNLKIPKIIELSNPKLIGSFLSGYFDADGYVSDEKGIIEISSASQEIYKKLPFLLHYLGCSHSIFIKKNKGKNYHYISIAGKDDLLTFKKNIGFRLTRKSVSLTNNIKKAVSNRKSDIFPISKDFLRNTRINLGLSQNQIPISFWGKYESNQNITKDIFYNFISFCENNNLLIKKKIKEKTEILKQSSKIKSIYLQNKSNFKTYNLLRELAADGLIKINNKNKSYKLTNFGKKIYSNWSKNPIDNILTTLISFKPLLNTEVHFVGIKEKRIVPSDTEFVYDLSEPFNENFVSNGFIIHNTQTLDTIRRTAVIKSEAGAITQMISSSSISLNTIQKICGDLLKGKNINLPGLVFIDTPGHAAFSNMRKRGGNLADIAILVVNINEGIKPQTIECIAILKKYKTPFVIALNKLDLIPGWQETNEKMVLNMIAKQSPNVQQHIETKLYEIVGKLHEEGFQTERFDRVHDYTNTIAMVPCSAKLGLGIPELLMVLMGLAQKFLEKNLETDLTGPAKGTVLEVKEEQGLGTTINAIIYEGTIKVNDPIIIGGVIEPIVTKVKGLFEPDEKNKFKPVKEIVAAAGIKLSAVGIKDVVSGMPFFVINNNEEELRQKIQDEVDEVLIETEKSGVVIKADSLGSLEAVIGMLQDKEIPIKKASVGFVTKKDITSAVSDEDPTNRVILCFNVKTDTDEVKIISHNIIYQLIDDLEAWREELRKKEEEKELDVLIKPAKMKYLQGCTFRQNNPCVVGVEILAGKLRPGVDLIKENGDHVGNVKTVQLEKDTLKEAEKGKQVAVSIIGPTAGRQINEGEIFYVDMNENNFRSLKRLKRFLKPDDVIVLKELAELKRKQNNLWGV